MKLKEILTTLIFVLCVGAANAQLYDAQWMLGPRTSIIDFRNDTVSIYAMSKAMNTKLTNGTISDEYGNLLYYTNGIYIAGSNGDSLLNGNGLSPCNYTSQLGADGLNIEQAAMFLPAPGDTRFYYLFHFSLDTSGPRPGTLYYSIIDKQGNLGLGEVTKKNVPFCKLIGRGGGMTACKHANGRDWWIIMARANTNCFLKFLLTPDGISDTSSQEIGPVYYGPFDDAYSCFSPDGSRFATVALEGYVTLLDFDRCTGNFSNPITISNIHFPGTVSGGASVAFSPNGRFVYVTDRVTLTQYDLDSTGNRDPKIIYQVDSNDFAQIDMVQLAPNGKLYGSTWSGGFYFIHVVNRPDEKGDGANFVYAGQPTLSDNSFNLPNMPNYRLGPLVGSGCDTITEIEEPRSKNQEPRLQPNPANKFVYVEMPMQGNYEMQLLNAYGQVVEQKQTKQVDIFNTEELPAGTYFLKVQDKNNPSHTCSQKVVIKH